METALRLQLQAPAWNDLEMTPLFRILEAPPPSQVAVQLDYGIHFPRLPGPSYSSPAPRACWSSRVPAPSDVHWTPFIARRIQSRITNVRGQNTDHACSALSLAGTHTSVDRSRRRDAFLARGRAHQVPAVCGAYFLSTYSSGCPATAAVFLSLSLYRAGMEGV
ncbi:hypothetical protein OH76DRAFT_700607 [Lentinus brumalis]|uniref:Uncharacterized protein n=1 Tax=Lentinus brumalis TaxID=2498619 RepID=A0A371D5M0_9APHY|nr:hypothetical protein OH76DRAFT_700607 [Polyporus brumalis]